MMTCQQHPIISGLLLVPTSHGPLLRSHPIMTIHNTSHHKSSHYQPALQSSLPHRSHPSSYDHHILDLNAHQRKTCVPMPIACTPIQSKSTPIPTSHILQAMQRVHPQTAVHACILVRHLPCRSNVRSLSSCIISVYTSPLVRHVKV
jgi:hypothetical protein